MVRGLAHLVSVIFHPILMATYMLILLMWINPFLFGVAEAGGRIDLVVLLLPTSVVIPVICVLLMKPLGFINSYDLKSREERIIPYITTAILYSWLFINIKNQPYFPMAYAVFFLGCLIALFLAFFINIFSKISAHCVGAGGLLGMIILTRAYYSYETVQINLFGWYERTLSVDVLVIVVLLIAGLIGTSRLVLNAHTRQDIYGGYIIGLSTQLIAFQILSGYGN